VVNDDDRYSDSFERSAGGMDYDDPVRERAASFGSTLASGGPEALFQEVEKLLPESWRENINHYPLTALAVGLGVGLFLGMKKGEQILAAGTSLIAAAATANLNQFISQRSGAPSESHEE
jgi:hypothetical protein